MRMQSFSRLAIVATFLCTLFSCNEKEDFSSDKLSDYIPLTAGKYITYRLDSLVFTNFGRNTEIHKYQVKHVVDAQITDNLGRPSYRIYRFIRDSVNTSSWTPAQPWINAGTYYITPLEDQVELIDDNLRTIKLHLPIRNGFSWKGNRYYPANTYSSKYIFSNDDNMSDWDFYYDGDASSFSYRNMSYTDVYTVEEEDFGTNYPITNPAAYAARTRAVEKYAKGIGLVYREYELWEYQPNPGGSGGPYKSGFGITQWMIDHN